MAPAGGMGELIARLIDHLRDEGVPIHFNTPYDIKMTTDVQIICTSAPEAGGLLKEVAPDLAFGLRNLEMVPLVSTTVFYSRESDDKVKGFGCLFPRDQGFRALGVLFNHDIFEGRSPHRSETWIYGGAEDRELINLGDREIFEFLSRDRERLFKRRSQALGYRIQRWPQAIPHYTTDLEKFLEDQKSGISGLEKNRIFLAGNYLGALGLSQILERASELPERIRHV